MNSEFKIHCCVCNPDGTCLNHELYRCLQCDRDRFAMQLEETKAWVKDLQEDLSQAESDLDKERKLLRMQETELEKLREQVKATNKLCDKER